MQEDHLPPFRVRPRFKTIVPFSPEILEEKLKAGLQKTDTVLGQAYPGYATFYMPHEEQHYWSPQLNLTFEKEENQTVLRGLYGPRPAVWTMFVFLYGVIAFAAMIVLIIGLSNYSLGKSAVILWLMPVLILIFLSLYLVAYFGQKMGHDQMLILHRFVEESLGIEIIN